MAEVDPGDCNHLVVVVVVHDVAVAVVVVDFVGIHVSGEQPMLSPARRKITAKNILRISYSIDNVKKKESLKLLEITEGKQLILR